MAAIPRNSLHALTPPIEESAGNGISTSLKILIVAVAAVAAAAFGFWLAGLAGAAVGLVAAGIVAWIAIPASSDQSNPSAENFQERQPIHPDLLRSIDAYCDNLPKYEPISQQADLAPQVQESLQISPALIAKIQELIPIIRTQQSHEEIQWLSDPFGHTRVFRLVEAPDLVFKMNPKTSSRIFRNNKWVGGSEQMEERFKNVRKGQQICQDHHLDLLVIPETERFYATDAQGKAHFVIVEQSLNLRADTAQKGLYRSCASGLDQAVRQLAIFIIHMGFSDVTPRNIPILDDAPEFPGNRRIGLIDLDTTEGAIQGISGSINGSTGLVSCLFSQTQIDAVLKIAVENNVITQKNANTMRAKRVEELTLDAQLSQFHQDRDLINNPLKPIEVANLDQLGLDLELVAPERKRFGVVYSPAVTMRQVAEDVIAEINRLIQENANVDCSIQDKRSILLAVNDEESPLGLHASCGSHLVPGHTISNTDLWIRKIIDALAAKGHLFQLIKENGHGYYIQA